MSAQQLEPDWRWWRAYEAARAAAISGNGHIPFKYYAEIFEIDEEETQALFEAVCRYIGISMNVDEQGPTFH